MTFNNHYPTQDKLYYLCHPFTSFGSMMENKISAAEYEKKLKQRNISVINPVSLAMGDTEPEAFKNCLILLSACKGIILCPGWERSKGCRMEFDFATKNGLEIIAIERDK